MLEPGRQGALTWDMRRREVDDYTEETAAKQFRLREVSDFHLYRKRPFLALEEKPAVASTSKTSSDGAIAYKHIVEIMAIQYKKGAYYESMSEGEKEAVDQFFFDMEIGNSNVVLRTLLKLFE